MLSEGHYSTAGKLEAIKMGEVHGYLTILTIPSFQIATMAQFVVQTHHGGKALLYEGYKYLKIRDGKERKFWRYERHKSQCQARVTTHDASVQCTCAIFPVRA